MPPVTVSPATNTPVTLFKTVTACVTVGAEEKDVTLIAVSPAALNNSNVFVVGFFTV